ncbi:uncharacterized protein A4U43_C03F6360 [Asparagus officinalis]|uniref:Thaumatin-like protein n=1 Tax=Asparagus officinalis TaxID=4686 RepID=A0A5P1FC75_ASPOF|nr:protein P21-like [Asparagus officinalis]ONK74449.1 uncharacterized protein A4U43_C03F6360 [Asparagus officinalis]
MPATAATLTLLIPFLFTLSHSTKFTITNQCPYTLWPASIPPAAQKLSPNQTWTLNIPSNSTGSIWARTNCTFGPTGHGSCSTGDCSGLFLCKSHGSSPTTIAEFALNQFGGQDFFDISLVNGFNVPMVFGPTATGCRKTRCTGDILGNCPSELRVDGGCDSPCDVFKTEEYCCSSGSCGPTNYSQFFKMYCPEAFSIPAPDGGASTLTCKSGTDYVLVFCP